MRVQRETMVERIVVELLADADRRAAVDVAAALSMVFGADIAGILIEERDLFDLAELGLASEIGMTTRRTRAAGAGDFVGEVMLSLTRHERAFAALAREIGRGVALARERTLAIEPLRRAGPTDLLLLCAASSRRLIERPMAEAILEAASRAAGVGIVGRPAPADRGPLVAVASSAEAAERALAILSELSEAYRTGLEIVVADTSLPSGQKTSADRGGVIRWTRVASAPVGHAAAELATARGAKLLIGESGSTLARNPAELQALLRSAPVPVLLLNADRD